MILSALCKCPKFHKAWNLQVYYQSRFRFLTWLWTWVLLALLLKNEILALVASLLTGAGSPTTLQAGLSSLFFFFPLIVRLFQLQHSLWIFLVCLERICTFFCFKFIPVPFIRCILTICARSLQVADSFLLIKFVFFV